MSAIAHTTIEFFEDAGPRSCTSWASCASRHSRAMAPIRPAPGASPGRTRQAADSTDRGGHGDVPGSVDDASLHAGGRAITARQPSFATRHVTVSRSAITSSARAHHGAPVRRPSWRGTSSTAPTPAPASSSSRRSATCGCRIMLASTSSFVSAVPGSSNLK